MKEEDPIINIYNNQPQSCSYETTNVQELIPQEYTTQNTILSSIPIQESSHDSSADDLTMVDDEVADQTYHPTKRFEVANSPKIPKGLYQPNPVKKRNITALQAYNDSRRKSHTLKNTMRIDYIENNEAYKYVLHRRLKRPFPKPYEYDNKNTINNSYENQEACYTSQQELRIIKNSCFISPDIFDVLTRHNPFEFLINMPKFIRPENQQSILEQLKQLYLVTVDKVRTRVKNSNFLFTLSCDRLFTLNERTVIVLFLHTSSSTYFLQMLYFKEYKELDIQRLVGESLKNFNITYDQILGITTGSCPILKEFAILTGSGHQKCLKNLINEAAEALFSFRPNSTNQVEYDDENQTTLQNLQFNSPILSVVRKIDTALNIINSSHSGRTLFKTKISFISALKSHKWHVLNDCLEKLISIQDELDAYLTYPENIEIKFSPQELRLIEDILFLFKFLKHICVEIIKDDCSTLYFNRIIKILATLDSSELSIKFLTELMGRFAADESYSLIPNILGKLEKNQSQVVLTQRQNALLTNINIKLVTKQNLTADDIVVKKNPKELLLSPHSEVEKAVYSAPFWLISKPGFYSETWDKRKSEIIQCLKMIRPSMLDFVRETKEDADKFSDHMYYISENYLESILFLKFNLRML